MQQIRFHAMGCRMMAAIDSELPDHQARLNEVPGWFDDWEQHLSRFRPDSELCQVNRRGGQGHISEVMSQVVREALAAQRQTDGLVNPLLLNALGSAGYDRNFTDLPQEITTHPMDVFPKPQNGKIELDDEGQTLALPTGSRLDLGGIAKGWAADRAAHSLGMLAPSLVDAGGDVAVSAPQMDGSPWPIGVIDPTDPNEMLDLVMLWEGGVATSGRDYRRWRKDGHWQHHIIDPRTGQPAVTDVLSATVIAPSTSMAEAAAKSVVILGSSEGKSWLDARPELSGLIVLEDGSLIPSRSWPDHIWR